MKKYLYVLCLMVSVGVFGACSSSTTTEQAKADAPTTNSAPPTNAAPAAPENAPANPGNYNASLEKSREVFQNEGNPNVPVVPRNPDADKDNNYRGRIAPDDSSFSSAMNAKGQFVETRMFNNHPQIVKVERVFATAKEKKIYVYLKNGKTVEVADEKLPNFQAEAPNNILVAAGVALVRLPPGEDMKTEQKPAN